jgi:hypothetical protein
MRAILIIAAFAASAVAVDGNPILMLPSYELTAENVTINVYQSESRVTGDYIFRAIRKPGPVARDEFADAWIGVTFPIILPTNDLTSRDFFDRNRLAGQWIQQRMDWVKPEGTIDGPNVVFKPNPYEGDWRNAAIAHGLDWRTQPELPDGWEADFFSGGLELAIASKIEGKGKEEPFVMNGFQPSDTKGLKIHISYTQPHLPGNISAYLPLLPDSASHGFYMPGIFATTNYLITFQAQNGIRFAPVGHYNIVGQSSDTNLSVRPVNCQLLKIQITFPTAVSVGNASNRNSVPFASPLTDTNH